MRILKLTAFLFLLCSGASARGRVYGFCEQGNQTVTVAGVVSSPATPVQGSCPAATVTVYITGSGGTKANIYADNAGTVLSNPFTIGTSPETSSIGYWFFYADNGTYDVQFSGTGVSTPFTLGAIPILDPTSNGTVTSFSGSGPAWLTWTVATPTTTPAVTLAATAGQGSHQVIGTCNTLTAFAPCTLVAGDLPSLSALYCAITGCTLTGPLLFTDASYDIGASGATRPRNIFLSGNIVAGGTLAITGHTTLEGVTSTGATGSGNIVYSGSPTLVTPALGTPSAVVLTNATALPCGALPALTGDTTSSATSCATVTAKINGGAFTGTNGHLVSFGASNTPADSGVVAANAVTAAAPAAAAAQVCSASGSSKTCTFIDFPDVRVIPAASCNNATAAIRGWDIPAGGTVTCRAGTNNLTGFAAITDTSTTFAQFTTAIPEDWDTATLPYIRFQIASTDTVSGHTIIPAIKVSCAKGDGSTTDDVTFNASHSLSTITLNSTANQFWSTSNIQMNSTDMTGCVGGSLMIVQVGRATDTATQAAFYSATLTFPRLIAVQAN
jgi:hypothetical protein